MRNKAKMLGVGEDSRHMIKSEYRKTIERVEVIVNRSDKFLARYFGGSKHAYEEWKNKYISREGCYDERGEKDKGGENVR